MVTLILTGRPGTPCQVGEGAVLGRAQGLGSRGLGGWDASSAQSLTCLASCWAADGQQAVLKNSNAEVSSQIRSDQVGLQDVRLAPLLLMPRVAWLGGAKQLTGLPACGFVSSAQCVDI